jgi:outer membrane protein
MNLRKTGVLALLLSAISLQAQDANKEKWSLEKCIDHAIENNITVKRSELTLESSKINHNQALYNFLPNVSGNANQNYNTGRSIDPFSNRFVTEQIRTNTFGVSAGVNVFNGFQNWSNLNQQKYNFLASQKDLEVTQNNISLSIANFYLQVLQNGEMLVVAKEQLKSSKITLENMKKLVDAGSRSEADLYTLMAQVSSDELNVQNAQNSYDMSLLNLKNLLNLNADTYFEVEKPTLNPGKIVVDSAVDIESLYLSTVESRPEVKSAELKVKASEFGVKSAKGGLSPTISLFANWNTRYSQNNLELFNPQTSSIPIGTVQSTGQTVVTDQTLYETREVDFNQQLQDNSGSSVGISMSIPLFNNGRNQNAIKFASIGNEQSKLNLMEAKLQFYKDITEAVTNTQSASKRLISTDNNLKSQKINYDFSTKRYESGAMNNADFSIAKNNYIIANAQFIQAKYQFVFTNMVLNFLKGNTITLE